MTNTKKGFTLIELLIVITIIGILAAALLPNILGAPARARDAARQADMNNIIAALEAFNADNGRYPDAAAATGSCINAIKAADLPLLQAYFPGGIPSDPSATASVGGCTGSYFYCRLDGSPANYMIASDAETDAATADATKIPGTTVGCDAGTGTQDLALFTAPGGAIAYVK